MRLVCPNCGAQYEVPDEVISSEGRDVQCSNCGITWYQPSAAAMAAGEIASIPGEDETFENEVETDAEGDWPAEEDAAGFDDEGFADEDDLVAADDLEEDEDLDGEDDLVAGEDEPFAHEDDFEDGADDLEPYAENAFAEEEYHEDLTEAQRPDTALAEAVTDSFEEDAEEVTEEDADTARYLDSDELDADFPEDGYAEPEIEDDGPDEDEEAAEAEAPEPELAAAAARVTPRRPLSSDVQSVLREEAAYEARARNRSADPLESQPDLGLGDPETEVQRRDRESRERLARLRGMTAMTAGAAAATAAPARAPEPAPAPPPPPPVAEPEAVDPAQASRRDLLPDIEEINSSLRTKGHKARGSTDATGAAEPQDQRRGFRLGFGLVLLFGALLILYYMHADWVRQTVPALEGPTDAYVAAADQFRVWLDVQARQLQTWMEGMSE